MNFNMKYHKILSEYLKMELDIFIEAPWFRNIKKVNKEIKKKVEPYERVSMLNHTYGDLSCYRLCDTIKMRCRFPYRWYYL